MFVGDKALLIVFSKRQHLREMITRDEIDLGDVLGTCMNYVYER